MINIGGERNSLPTMQAYVLYYIHVRFLENFEDSQNGTCYLNSMQQQENIQWCC